MRDARFCTPSLVCFLLPDLLAKLHSILQDPDGRGGRKNEAEVVEVEGSLVSCHHAHLR